MSYPLNWASLVKDASRMVIRCWEQCPTVSDLDDIVGANDHADLNKLDTAAAAELQEMALAALIARNASALAEEFGLFGLRK